jgi:cytochrome c-type biogenesis protein CcmH/NrfG
VFRVGAACLVVAWLLVQVSGTLFENSLTLAAQHYERAMELAPSNVRIVGDAASLLKGLGRMDECIALDEYVVARDPVNPVGFFNLGGSYLYAGRYADAIAAYRKALQLSPNRLGGHYHLGLAQLLSGNAAEAMQSMDREPLEVLQLLGRVMAHHALNDQDSVDPTVRIAGMARSYIPV